MPKKQSVEQKQPMAETVTGVFISNPKGFGFVEVEGQDEDYYIPEQKIHGAFHKDTVEIRPLSKGDGKRREAEIVRVLERSVKQVVGTYEKGKNFGFVVPDSLKLTADIFIPKEQSKKAVNGHKVVVELTDYGSRRRNPEGKIIEILGHANDPGIDILSIVKDYGLPVEFPAKALRQGERVANEVSEADMAGRMDLRDVRMVTIDGEDAKDLDDAVFLAKKDGLYYLGVHIADVANYVQENSALDREALKRGTSVYLTDRVIPMLPHVLSNGICSLNAGEDRLALSCMMTIDKNGNVIDHAIAETIIRVARRMSYTEVKKILEDKDRKLLETCKEFVPMLQDMAELSGILRKKRRKRGAIDFDFAEAKIVLDGDGHPVDIKPYERNTATKLIEDFMLIANETIAQHFYWMELPFLYRSHDKPDKAKIEQLGLFLRNFGYHMKMAKDEVHPKELQKLLERVEGTPEEALVARLTLRSMKQARYTVDCSGHFGLASPYYCHFTSPIRRYPDLQIHRIIKDYLRGRFQAPSSPDREGRAEHYARILPEAAKLSSAAERRADEAERETDKLKKAEYMKDRIGEVYEGVISGITGWGLYVELPNTVEGLVHISTLPGDSFRFDEAAYELIGRKTRKKYKLGKHVTIQVHDVDIMNRTIDFRLTEDAADEEIEAEKGGREQSGKRKRKKTRRRKQKSVS